MYQKINTGAVPFAKPSIEPFSPPTEAGYNDTSITDDMIRDVYMAFIERTRSEESDEYLRNLNPGTDLSKFIVQLLTGICLSADNTFKVAKKETVVDADPLLNHVLEDATDPQAVLQDLNIDPVLLFQPQASTVQSSATKSPVRRLEFSKPDCAHPQTCCRISKFS